MSTITGKCIVCSSPDGVSPASHHPCICPVCTAEIEQRLEGTKRRQVDKAQVIRKLAEEKSTGTEYVLRDIPQELMNKAKHMAVDQGSSVKDIFLQAIEAYLV